jgi:transcription elongation factor Elf1
MSKAVITAEGKPVTCNNCGSVEWTNVRRVGNKITANCGTCGRRLELTLV